MADTASTLIGAAHVPAKSPLGQPLDFDIRGLGRRLPRTEAPEGWVKKIARSREGKVWVGFFHLWTTDANGRRVRTKKEKTLGPASMAKARGAGETNRVHHGIHRQAHHTRRLDHDLQRALEGLLRREVRSMVEEDQGKSPVSFCENTFFRSSEANHRGKSR